MRLASLSLVLLASTVAPALAADFELPERKPGMWDIKMVTSKPAGMPEMVIKVCIDPATDKQMMSAGLSMSEDMCQDLEWSEDGDSYVLDATCTMGNMTATSHVVISGDFDSEYTVEVTGRTEGGPMAGDMEMTQTATWMGDACTDDLKPGEMLLPGGMKVDATKLLGAMGGG